VRPWGADTGGTPKRIPGGALALETLGPHATDRIKHQKRLSPNARTAFGAGIGLAGGPVLNFVHGE
jgi:hypothetical protein